MFPGFVVRACPVTAVVLLIIVKSMLIIVKSMLNVFGSVSRLLDSVDQC